MFTDIKEQLEKIYSLLYDEQVEYIYAIMNDLRGFVYPYLENSKAAQDKLYSLIEKFNTDFNNFSTVFSTYSTKFNTYSKNFDSFVYSTSNKLDKLFNTLSGINNKLADIIESYYPTYYINTEYSLPTRQGWVNFYSSFSEFSFQEVMLDVLQQMEDLSNPLSENNKESFDAAMTNFNENTFIGSANELITTFPGELTKALTKDSSPVLQFKTASASNSYFSLPARTFSIDFSWYAPFKSTADTVISAFIYIGFIIAFIKRLPEILHGAGIITDSYNNFQEAQFEDHLAEEYYNHFSSNGGYDDLSF